MNVDKWLKQSELRLDNAGITSCRLDAQLLLGKVLNCDRTWLLAHPSYPIKTNQLLALKFLIKRRLDHEPMAYIFGKKEFYRRDFQVGPDVLIPRPETEQIIDTFLSLMPNKNDRVLDVGTGSGCIAITIALEMPELKLFAVDISEKCLDTARLNALTLNAQVHFYKQDLLSGDRNGPYNFIIANLPYLDITWPRSIETKYEPHEALFADGNGLQQIMQLLKQAKEHLRPHGYLLLEADTSQLAKICRCAKGYNLINKTDYGLCFQIAS